MMALMTDAAFMERRAVNLRAERVAVILLLHKPKDVLISATKDETTETVLPQRMDHGQIAIQTDAAQEADADVDVLVEQETTHLTQPFSVTPIIVLKQQQQTEGGSNKTGRWRNSTRARCQGRRLLIMAQFTST